MGKLEGMYEDDLEPTHKEDVAHAKRSLWIALTVVLIEYLFFLLELNIKLPGWFTGVHPRSIDGLPGIVLAPVIHGGWLHLFSNLPPLFVSIWGISYLYHSIRLQVLIASYLIPGVAVWFWDDPHIHIGASGWVYCMLAFLFTSGIMRKHPRSVALSLIIVFLYGSLVWRIFPGEPGISWQSHLSGLTGGILLSFFFRRIEIFDPWRQGDDLLDDDPFDDERLTENFPVRRPDDYAHDPFGINGGIDSDERRDFNQVDHENPHRYSPDTENDR